MMLRCERALERLKALRGTVQKRATPGEYALARLFPNKASGFPGTWTSDRAAQASHFTQAVHMAIDAIWSKGASVAPNLAYSHSQQVRGVTTKGGQRGLLNLQSRDFNGSPTVEAPGSTLLPYAGWDPREKAQGDWSSYLGGGPQPVGTSGGGHSWLTIGEYRSKSLSVIKPHEELEPLEHDHPLRRLIENPNPWDTQYDYDYEWGLFSELHGVAYEWLVPNRLGVPCERWIIPSHWVWPRTGGTRIWQPEWHERSGIHEGHRYVPIGDPQHEFWRHCDGGSGDPSRWYEHPDQLISYYEVRPWGGFGSAGVLRLPPDQVIMSRQKSPLSKVDGWSKLTAAAEWIDSQESITRSEWSSYINRAEPSLAVELGPGYEDMDDDRVARAEARFAMKFAGESNVGKTIFTPPGAKLTPLSFNPQQMAYGENKMQSILLVLAVWRVTKTVVGLAEDLTYGSLLASLASFCSYCLNPKLAARGQTETKHLASRWDEKAPAYSSGFDVDGDTGTVWSRSNGGNASARRCKLWYDDTVPADPAQVNADISTDSNGNCCAITPNEVRALRGRKPYAHGGDDPMGSGPGGIQPIPINTGEDLSDLAKLIAPMTSAEGQQSDDSGGGGQGGAGGVAGLLPPPSGGDQGGAAQPEDMTARAEEAQQEAEEANASEDAGIENPNGKPTKKALANQDAGPIAAGLAVVAKGVTVDTAAALTKVGEELAQRTEPPLPMPGYGQIFSQEGKVWYVGGDGDDRGFGELVEQKVRQAYPGCTEFHYEAETFPPKDEGWVQVYPRKGAQKGRPFEKAGQAGQPCTPGHTRDRDRCVPAAGGAGGASKPRPSGAAASPRPRSRVAAPAHHPGAAHGSKVKVVPSKRRAIGPDLAPVRTKTTLSKQETGRIGEAVIHAWLATQDCCRDVRALNAGRANEAIDAVADHLAPEIKAGLASNGKDAQKWRITFSMELSADKKAKYEAMTPEQRSKFNAKMQEECLKRKRARLKQLSAELGHEVKPMTLTCILNPDTRTADIYMVPEYHSILRWKDAVEHYAGSVKYDHA